jgi:hypothetical protein
MKKSAKPVEKVNAPQPPVADAGSQKSAAAPTQQPPGDAEGKLSLEKQAELDGHEKTIEQGFGSFVDVGNALKAIDDGELYQTSKDQDFKGYCKTRWQMSAKYGYRLIKAADFVGRLKETTGTKNAITVFPIHESQVRPIVDRLKANQWVSTWRQVLDKLDGKEITAAKVAEVVREKLGKPTPLATKHVNPATAQEMPNNSLQPIVDLVKDARSKTKGATIEFYKQTLDRIWGELEKQMEAA